MADSARSFQAERLSEFTYGIITAMIAVSGVDAAHASWWAAALIVVVGAAAVWMAHAYSKLIGVRLAAGHPLTAGNLAHAAQETWPIVSAGALLALPFLPVALGAYSIDLALEISSGAGVVLLALIGFRLGVVAGNSWGRRFLLAALSAALGVVIVIAEIAIHH